MSSPFPGTAPAVFRVGRNGDELFAEWPGLGRLVVDRDATAPRFEAVPGADADLIAKLRSSAVPALLRHLRGEMTLHAAAFACHGGAVALTGDPGAGKSTLVYACCTLQGRTSEMLADDSLHVDRSCLALPTEAAGWLCADSRKAFALPGGGAKRAVVPQRIATTPAPLRRVIELTFRGSFAVRRLRGVDAARALGRALVRFVLDEPAVHRADLDRLAALSSRVEVFEMARPSGFEHIPDAVRAVEEVISW